MHKEPKKKFALTLYFDTKVGRSNFKAWYLDGVGEQSSHYFTQKFDKNWMHLTAPWHACPKCEYAEHEDITSEFFYNNRFVRKEQFKCSNCQHAYSLDNPYLEESVPKYRKKNRKVSLRT
jgi:hypothetical protein